MRKLKSVHTLLSKYWHEDYIILFVMMNEIRDIYLSPFVQETFHKPKMKHPGYF